MELGLVQWFPYGEPERIPRVAAKLRELGVRNIRTPLSSAAWSRPDGPAWLDRVVDGLDGFDILPVLHSAPPSPPEKPEGSSVPRDLDLYLSFVRWVCGRYVDRFTHVELCDEPTTRRDSDAAPDAWRSRFAELISAAAREAHALDKQVVMAGISSPDGALLGARISGGGPHFLEIMESAGALGDVDVIAFHGSPEARHRSHGWLGWDAEIGPVVQWSAARGRATWITETGGARPTPGDCAEELRAVVDAAARTGVERVYWCSVEDATGRSQRELELELKGLLSPRRRPRPSTLTAKAERRAVTIRSPRRPLRDTSDRASRHSRRRRRP